MSPQSKELKNKYDVVVIGAGIGGLTCGAYLAKEGLSVLVAEQHSLPGGLCTSFKRKGFTFDVGTDLFPGVEKGGMLRKVLKELGLDNELEFVKLEPLTRIVGSDYDVPFIPLDSTAKELKKMFPAERESIDALVKDFRAVVDEMGALIEPAPDLLGFGGKMGLVFRFLFKSKHFRKFGKVSYRQVLESKFKDPKLRAILGAIVDWDLDWAAYCFMIMGYRGGFYYPKGSAQGMADTLAKCITEHGGELALDTKVTKIKVQNGRAIGVKLAKGSEIKSKYVVSNVDGRQTFLKMVGEKHLKQKFVTELKKAHLTEPVFLVSLGVDMDLVAQGFDGTTIVYNRSENLKDLWSGNPEKCSLWIMMHSLRDPSQAPEGNATVQIMTPFPYDHLDHWKREKDGTRGESYKMLKEALADKFVKIAEDVIPGLSERIVYRDVATPLTYERYTLNSEAAGHGWFPTPGARMRSQKTPIKNLFQAGHWTSPGFGIFCVVLSGRTAAKLVLKDMKND